MKFFLFVLFATLSIASFLGVSTRVFAAEGDTYLNFRRCTAGNPVVENPYDIDFGSFSSDEVNGVSKLNTGTTVSGTLHVSNSPSVATADRYLVVFDKCGDNDWYADLLASDMSDINVSNPVTGNPIDADNIALSNANTVYFLETTPAIAEVTTQSVVDQSLSSPIQLLQRTLPQGFVAGLFGVKPTYELTIPAFQQPDRYQGTITWTVYF